MLAYRTLNGAYVFVPPGKSYPTLQPSAPQVYPDTGGSRTPSVVATWVGSVTSPNNSSSQSMVDLSDENYTQGGAPPPPPTTANPVVNSPTVVEPIFATPTTAPETPKKIVGVSPLGLMAVGAGLIAAWAIFRS